MQTWPDEGSTRVRIVLGGAAVAFAIAAPVRRRERRVLRATLDPLDYAPAKGAPQFRVRRTVPVAWLALTVPEAKIFRVLAEQIARNVIAPGMPGAQRHAAVAVPDLPDRVARPLRTPDAAIKEAGLLSEIQFVQRQGLAGRKHLAERLVHIVPAAPMLQQPTGGLDCGGVVLSGQQHATAVANHAHSLAAGAVDLVQTQARCHGGGAHENGRRPRRRRLGHRQFRARHLLDPLDQHVRRALVGGFHASLGLAGRRSLRRVRTTRVATGRPSRTTSKAAAGSASETNSSVPRQRRQLTGSVKSFVMVQASGFRS